MANAGLDSAQLAALGTDFTEAELTTLETVMSRKQLAAFYASPHMGKPGLAVIHDCAINPNIRGLKEWVDFTSKKVASGWRNSIGELREALRTVKADPSEIVEVDTDAHTPKKTGKHSPQGTPQDAPSFDLTVSDAATGVVKRSVEITSVRAPITRSSDPSLTRKHGSGHSGEPDCGSFREVARRAAAKNVGTRPIPVLLTSRAYGPYQ